MTKDSAKGEQKDCHICQGSGVRVMYDNFGKSTGRKLPCDHGAAMQALVGKSHE